jgi:DNA-binding PadR family transcriptional regulator
MASKALTGAAAEPIVLSILAAGDSYGYAIIKRVRDLSGGEVDWAAGSLYPVLHRMKAGGLIESYWVEEAAERKRRYYRLTPKGRKALEAEQRRWLTMHNILARLWGLPPLELDLLQG